MPPAIPLIGSALAALGSAGAATGTAIGSGLGALGVGAETAADIGAIAGPTLVGAGEGAGVGALGSAITGGNPLTGAEFGAATGGLLSGGSAGLGLLTGPAGGAAAAPVSGVPATTASALPGGAAGAAATAPAGIAAPADATATGVLGSLTGGAGSAAPAVAAGSTPVAPAGAAAGFSPAESQLLSGANASSTTAIPQSEATLAAQQAGTAAGPSSLDKFWNDPSWGNALGIAKANPSAVLGGLGLGYDILHQGNIPGMGALQNEATMAQHTSQELNSYINSGQLPPGFQASMDQAKQAAKAQLRSKYASLGMSGSTAESQDLANVDVQAVAAQAQVAAQLLQSGIQESGVAGDLLSHIVGINQQQDALTSQAISAFAAALGPNEGGIQLYLRPPGG